VRAYMRACVAARVRKHMQTCWPICRVGGSMMVYQLDWCFLSCTAFEQH